MIELDIFLQEVGGINFNAIAGLTVGFIAAAYFGISITQFFISLWRKKDK
jgi:hypothetical protein